MSTFLTIEGDKFTPAVDELRWLPGWRRSFFRAHPRDPVAVCSRCIGTSRLALVVSVRKVMGTVCWTAAALNDEYHAGHPERITWIGDAADVVAAQAAAELWYANRG